MSGLLVTFEGTEGSGKSTQIVRLADRLKGMGRSVLVLREPGGTPIGEEIRHTLKHSPNNQAMTSEAELLLMMAARAQLVRETIRPALANGQIVLCDRFYDSSTVYQGYGRGLDINFIRTLIDFAVGATHPQLTLLLMVPLEISEVRRGKRQSSAPIRDRIEDAGRHFFQRVEEGYRQIAEEEPKRIRILDATQTVEAVQNQIWQAVEPILPSGHSRLP